MQGQLISPRPLPLYKMLPKKCTWKKKRLYICLFPVLHPQYPGECEVTCLLARSWGMHTSANPTRRCSSTGVKCLAATFRVSPFSRKLAGRVVMSCPNAENKGKIIDKYIISLFSLQVILDISLQAILGPIYKCFLAKVNYFRAHSHCVQWLVFFHSGSMPVTARVHRKHFFSVLHSRCSVGMMFGVVQCRQNAEMWHFSIKHQCSAPVTLLQLIGVNEMSLFTFPMHIVTMQGTTKPIGT